MPERHRDGAFDLQRMRSSGHGPVGEGAVDAGPGPCCGEGIGVFGPYGGRRGCRPRRDRGRFRNDEGSRDPVGPGDGAEEGMAVVHILPFPFGARRGSSGMATGARHRSAVIGRRPENPAHHVPHDRIVQFASHFGDTPSVRAGKPGADRGYVRRPLRTGNAPDRPSSRQASASRSRRHPMIGFGCATGGTTTAQRPRMGLVLGLRKHPGSRSATPGTMCRKATGSECDVGFRASGLPETPIRQKARNGNRPGTGPRPGFPGAFPGPWSRPGNVLRGIGRGHPRRTRPRDIGPPPPGRRSMRAPCPRGRHCRCRRTGTPQGRYRASHTGRCARTARPAAVRTDHPQAPCGVGDIAAKA